MVINMINRHLWFKKRIADCVTSLQILDEQNWEEYLKISHEIAKEIAYAATEWEKYYLSEKELNK